MMSVKDKVLETIEEKEISPKPKWAFQARTVFLWTSVGLSVVTGGLAISVVVYLSVNGDWDVIARLPDRATFVIFTLPYAWALATALALVAAHFQYRRTKDAYRHRYGMTVLALLIATCVLGAIFYNTGVGQLFEARLHNVPGYARIANPRASMWNMAKEGRLAGEVLELTGEMEIKLLDHTHKIWVVYITDETEMPVGILLPGRRVRVLGEYVGPMEFRASGVLPWLPHEADRLRIERLRRVFPSP